jgi:hypothetical protein
MPSGQATISLGVLFGLALCAVFAYFAIRARGVKKRAREGKAKHLFGRQRKEEEEEEEGEEVGGVFAAQGGSSNNPLYSGSSPGTAPTRTTGRRGGGGARASSSAASSPFLFKAPAAWGGEPGEEPLEMHENPMGVGSRAPRGFRARGAAEAPPRAKGRGAGEEQEEEQEAEEEEEEEEEVGAASAGGGAGEGVQLFSMPSPHPPGYTQPPPLTASLPAALAALQRQLEETVGMSPINPLFSAGARAAPARAATPSAAAAPPPPAPPPGAAAPSSSTPLSPWVRKWSAKKQAHYFVHSQSGESTWVPPEETVAMLSNPLSARKEEAVRTFTAAPPAPLPALGPGDGGAAAPQWVERSSRKYPGVVFYVNSATGERVWELPSGVTPVRH